MRTLAWYVVVLVILLFTQNLLAQDQDVLNYKIDQLEKKKAAIKNSEREALKVEIGQINIRMDNGGLSIKEADSLKMKAAENHARNIENKLVIIENYIDLLKRNGDLDLNMDMGRIVIGLGAEEEGGDKIFGIKVNTGNQNNLKYDQRTFSNPVIGVGLNNTLIDGQSLQDTPYKVGGSRFFELGYVWRTRVFKNSNFLRLNYGVSFQFNGLKPKDNSYFVVNGSRTELMEFEYDLDKSKFRMDNVVLPVHFEFGPSRVKKTDQTIRYSIHKQFRLGLGGYAGINMGSRQKLKYERDGDRVKDKFKRDYNTNDFVYGLSAYTGVGEALIYLKYDLNPIFNNALVDQHNISLGLRFDL
ncbi:hypothetical protein DHD05_08230 [Arenibacter sp. N53]|uniref:hypothetical protein n=1 Tax=Arenibacter TaxID=178469 RepID=UPI000CD3ED13|nr:MULTISPECIES: hypothetical protein [Arenibacter]MCM4151573.1 hypothetical protein [Arenibacter sp. N53]